MWACERGVFANAGGLHSNISSSGRCCAFFCVFVGYLHGLYALFMEIVAIYLMLFATVFLGFRRQAIISCHLCRFFGSLVFLVLCAGFF